MSTEKTQGQLLQEELTFEFPIIAKDNPDRVAAAFDFSKGYMKFISAAKTERECVTEAVAMLEAAGYVPFDYKAEYKAGDKVYFNNRNKAIIATTFGTEPVENGVRLNAAHIDCPRLDLKPNPLYEKDDIALFKTHYYGGIRKYQWVTIPLALHGVVCKKNGEIVNVNIGEDPADPVFYITDLLPHLSGKQNTRSLAEGIKGEELNIVVGSLPYADDKVKNPVKLQVLSILNEKYGITERDFLRAELSVVAAGPARDVGFDRALIMAPGHDDRVCSYPAIRAEIDTVAPTYTTVTVLVDKEEIGSVGNTGLNSDFLRQYVSHLCQNQGADYMTTCMNSLCLSSDVSVAWDPTFPDVTEPLNTAYIGKGPCLTKYTGARGKSGSSDASAETMAKVIALMEKEGVYFQTCELGKVDEGGGGTVAQYVAGMNIDVVDFGVPVLSMHAPEEIISKIDVHEAYLAYMAFYK